MRGPDTSLLVSFLQRKEFVDGCYQISPPRAYHHDESDYDRQYNLDTFHLEQLSMEARHILALCHDHGLPKSVPVLEIGCGTGRISVGLATHPDVGHLLITDPSPVFCRIVQRKLKSLDVKAPHVDFGVLLAEDVALLPAGSVSLIILRSVLHHILNVDEFLAACAKVLPSGGLLMCEEPYYEGYMMMGFLAQFIADSLATAGYTCTQEDRQRIDGFIAGMQYYCCRDIDKSSAEDKHLFRPDELMATGLSLDLELRHHPNWLMTLAPEQNRSSRNGYFQRFFVDYVRYCMDWPQDFVDRVAEATKKYFRFFEGIESRNHTTPHCYGTFVFAKR